MPQETDARDKSLAKVASQYASDASRETRKMDDSDAPGRINAGWIGLRALWTIWSVVVRVHSGALRRNYGFVEPKLRIDARNAIPQAADLQGKRG